MKVRYLGHACFALQTTNQTRIVMDPYTTAETLRYGEIKESAEIVTISHKHYDHNNAAAIKNSPRIIDSSGEVQVDNINILGIPSYHDNIQGAKAGANIIFCIEADQLRICHLGDLGHLLNQEQLSHIGKIDILFVPVGGVFTIEPATAKSVCESIKPRIIIPMHYKTDKGGFKLVGVNEFTKLMPNVKKLPGSEIELTRDKLPLNPEVIVLKPQL